MDDAVGAYAAFAAFFVIVSFFPFVMLLLTLMQFLPFSAQDMTQFIQMWLPSAVIEMIAPLIEEIYSASTGLISVTAFAAIWAASKGIYALVCGLNSVYGVKETRNIIVVRAMSIFYTVVFLGLIIGCMTLLIFGKMIFDWLELYAPWLSFLAHFRLLIGLLIFILFFLVIFRALPNRSSGILSELPGAIIAAIGWVLFSMIYSYYIDNFSSFPIIYGSITAVVFMMLWLYFCMYITLLAAEINSLGKRNRRAADVWNMS